MRRLLSTILVALLLTTAGCSGILPGQSEPTADISATPVPVPGNGSYPPGSQHVDIADNVSYPPGVTEAGLENGVALREANADWISGKRYTVVRTVIRERTQSAEFDKTETRLEIANNTSFYLQRTTYWDESQTMLRAHSLWATGDKIYEHEVEGNQTETDVVHDGIVHPTGERTIDGIAEEELALLLSTNGNVTVEPASVTINGEQAFVLTGKQISEDDFFDSPQYLTETDGFAIENVTIRVLVTSEGKIWSYHYALFGERDGESYTERATVEYKHVGQGRVHEPHWADELNGTDSDSTQEAASA